MSERTEPDAAHAAAGRVIVTYARSYQTLTAIRSLGRRGVAVIAGDEYALTVGKLSRYTTGYFQYPSPSADPEGFLDVLDRVIDENRPPAGQPYVLMPIHRESPLIARERTRFVDRVAIPLAPYDSFRIAQHKVRLARYAEELAVPVPRTWTPRGEEELYEAARDIRFPVFLKLPTQASGVGVEKIADAHELRRSFREVIESRRPRPEDYPFVQESVEGDDYCVTALFDRGTLRACMTYRNVLTWPRGAGAGAGVIRETVSAPAAERHAERLLRSLAWHGVAQVDFRWTGRDEDPPKLLEVNPRFFGGLFQAVESGVDYPWLLFQVAAGIPFEPPRVELGVRTDTPVTALLATVREIAAEEESVARLTRGWREAKEHAKGGEGWGAVKSVVRGLRETLDVEARVEHARRLLQENERNVSMLFDGSDDPLPVLGLLLPLAVFLRHGKVTGDLLIDAQGDSPDDA